MIFYKKYTNVQWENIYDKSKYKNIVKLHISVISLLS